MGRKKKAKENLRIHNSWSRHPLVNELVKEVQDILRRKTGVDPGTSAAVTWILLDYFKNRAPQYLGTVAFVNQKLGPYELYYELFKDIGLRDLEPEKDFTFEEESLQEIELPTSKE